MLQNETPEEGNLFLNLTIRRAHFVEDSINEVSELLQHVNDWEIHLHARTLPQLALKQADLKKKVKVTFAGEPGLDMGGLTKEWFLLLTRNIFQPEFGLCGHSLSLVPWPS